MWIFKIDNFKLLLEQFKRNLDNFSVHQINEIGHNSQAGIKLKPGTKGNQICQWLIAQMAAWSLRNLRFRLIAEAWVRTPLDPIENQ